MMYMVCVWWIRWSSGDELWKGWIMNLSDEVEMVPRCRRWIAGDEQGWNAEREREREREMNHNEVLRTSCTDCDRLVYLSEPFPLRWLPADFETANLDFPICNFQLKKCKHQEWLHGSSNFHGKSLRSKIDYRSSSLHTLLSALN